MGEEEFAQDSGLVSKETVFRLYEEANRANQRGDLETDLAITRELLSIVQQEMRVYAEIALLIRIGNLYHNLANLRYAFAYRQAALELANTYADGILPMTRINLLIDIGRSYIEMEDLEKGEQYTRQALVELEALPEEAGREDASIVIQNNLSMVLAGSGHLQEAIDLLLETLPAAEARGNPYFLGLIHLNLAAFSLNQLKVNQSRRYAEKAAQYADEARDPNQRAQASLLMGSVFTRARFFTGTRSYSDDAVRYLERTLRMAENLGNPIIAADTLIELAMLNEDVNHIKEAADYFRQALETLDRVRGELGYEVFQLSYFASLRMHYEQAISFQLRHKQSELAFQTSERLRSRLLLTLLGPSRLPASGIEAADRKAFDHLLNRYSALVLERFMDPDANSGFTSGIPTRGGADPQLEEPELETIRRAFIELYNQQRARSVEWMGRQSPAVAAPEEVQGRLNPDEALISYLVLADGLVIFVLTREGMHFQQLTYPQAKLEAEIEGVCRQMADLQDEVLDPFTAEQWFNRIPSAPFPRPIQLRLSRLLNSLEHLYAMLIAPVLPAMHACRHWTIIPSGPLNRVPWPALHTREGYLVESHSLSLQPSASITAVMLAEQSGSGIRARSGEVLLLGDPESGRARLALPGARREIDTLQRLFPGTQAVFSGPEANKEHLIDWAPRCDLLHIACHHFFDGSVPLLSFLKLAGERGAGNLYAFEVADLELHAGLVTLSACDSGRGRVATGDEQFGIVRSFLAAGAGSVISTLWNIQDESAGFIFSDFYRRAQTSPIGQALAETQRRALASSVYNLPCFWAPYVLTGRWRDPMPLASNSSANN